MLAPALAMFVHTVDSLQVNGCGACKGGGGGRGGQKMNAAFIPSYLLAAWGSQRFAGFHSTKTLGGLCSPDGQNRGVVK